VITVERKKFQIAGAVFFIRLHDRKIHTPALAVVALVAQQRFVHLRAAEHIQAGQRGEHRNPCPQSVRIEMVFMRVRAQQGLYFTHVYIKTLGLHMRRLAHIDHRVAVKHDGAVAAYIPAAEGARFRAVFAFAPRARVFLARRGAEKCQFHPKLSFFCLIISLS